MCLSSSSCLISVLLLSAPTTLGTLPFHFAMLNPLTRSTTGTYSMTAPFRTLMISPSADVAIASLDALDMICKSEMDHCLSGVLYPLRSPPHRSPAHFSAHNTRNPSIHSRSYIYAYAIKRS
ncbi:hypothetical protein BJ138DRAFT_509569 [Hygrophoropsis aurantiaca]|uniref:Uncharacterized protein n=1 Tax=Hygrophoropsis aurantiaca TaxID=72124 RepID=A0ACB8A3P5_9AGAM|nr:hypothetical protein BJ138DRAFT_509569 [Hygrophoropsis aurantiaca]